MKKIKKARIRMALIARYCGKCHRQLSMAIEENDALHAELAVLQAELNVLASDLEFLLFERDALDSELEALSQQFEDFVTKESEAKVKLVADVDALQRAMDEANRDLAIVVKDVDDLPYSS